MRIGPFRKIHTKYPGWKYWMRFKRPIAIYEESGCFDDSCGQFSDEAGCKCNNFHAKRLAWTNKGFSCVGYYFSTLLPGYTFRVFSNGDDIVIENGLSGR